MTKGWNLSIWEADFGWTKWIVFRQVHHLGVSFHQTSSVSLDKSEPLGVWWLSYYISRFLITQSSASPKNSTKGRDEKRNRPMVHHKDEGSHAT